MTRECALPENAIPKKLKDTDLLFEADMRGEYGWFLFKLVTGICVGVNLFIIVIYKVTQSLSIYGAVALMGFVFGSYVLYMLYYAYLYSSRAAWYFYMSDEIMIWGTPRESKRVELSDVVSIIMTDNDVRSLSIKTRHGFFKVGGMCFFRGDFKKLYSKIKQNERITINYYSAIGELN